MKLVKIPEYEYKERVKKAAELVKEMGLDVLVVSSTESDYADVRYFSGFWPLFERAGVAISASGEVSLMCGLESDIFAKDMGCIEKVFVVREYRESADPAAPHLVASTFKDVFKSVGVTGENIKIGVASWLNTTLVIMDGIKENYPNAQIVRADSIMRKLRSIKSDNEIACMKQGSIITEYAISEVLKYIKPGMSETQVVGIAQRAVYEKGAEYEGLPMYVFSQKSTSHAISRPRPDREIGKGDIVQLNLSAKVDGYSPAIGMPIFMGTMDEKYKEYVEFCLKMHNWTKAQLKAGAIASKIATDFYDQYVENGYKDNYLYGPCHGTGLIEVEPPWMEDTSEYPLVKNMTFMVDTFILTPQFGARWEMGAVITQDGYDELCTPVGKIYELGF